MAGDALTASPGHVSGSEIQKLLNTVGAAFPRSPGDHVGTDLVSHGCVIMQSSG